MSANRLATLCRGAHRTEQPYLLSLRFDLMCSKARCHLCMAAGFRGVPSVRNPNPRSSPLCSRSGAGFSSTRCSINSLYSAFSCSCFASRCWLSANPDKLWASASSRDSMVTSRASLAALRSASSAASSGDRPAFMASMRASKSARSLSKSRFPSSLTRASSASCRFAWACKATANASESCLDVVTPKARFTRFEAFLRTAPSTPNNWPSLSRSVSTSPSN
mmetsp:Transcript_11285/g.29561  ORF Transcript_11285/g.29561 Transcript_11285/m.29561 type:complete len:221 (-) Transcript_11285:148-810(-)